MNVFGTVLISVFVAVIPVIAPPQPNEEKLVSHVAPGDSAVFSFQWTATDRAAPSGCVECYETLWCSVLGHVADLQSGAEFSVPHSDCRDGRYCDGHPACIYSQVVDPVAFDLAVEKAVRGSTGDLFALAERFPEHVTLNRSRASLQISGACPAAGLIANVPLTRQEFEEVGSLLDRRLATGSVGAGE